MLLSISVVISNFNRGNSLNGAIQSYCDRMLNASLNEFNVVDNNSTDDKRATLGSFAHRRNIYNF
jgi:hypothetical protein